MKYPVDDADAMHQITIRWMKKIVDQFEKAGMTAEIMLYILINLICVLVATVPKEHRSKWVKNIKEDLDMGLNNALKDLLIKPQVH